MDFFYCEFPFGIELSPVANECKVYEVTLLFLFVLYQMSKRDEMIDRLKSETSYLKDQQRDKEREVRIFFYNIFVFFVKVRLFLFFISFLWLNLLFNQLNGFNESTS